MMGSSTGLHLVERFTRIAPDVLQYDVTMSDPYDVDAALDRADPVEADRRAADRVRVPRRQYRDVRYSRGRPETGSGRGRR